MVYLHVTTKPKKEINHKTDLLEGSTSSLSSTSETGMLVTALAAFINCSIFFKLQKEQAADYLILSAS